MKPEALTSTDRPDLTIVEKMKIHAVEKYWLNQKSTAAARRSLRVILKRKNYDDIHLESSISKIVKKFHDAGSILDQRKGHSGPKITVTTPENIEKVDKYFEENPESSTRRASAE